MLGRSLALDAFVNCEDKDGDVMLALCPWKNRELGMSQEKLRTEDDGGL